MAGKVSKDPKLAEAEIHNRDFDLQVNEQRLPSIRTISACYAVPKQITPHSYKLLPNQPEMHFNYKLIARLKRDTTRLSHHPWPDGANVGRDARQVAEEIASGITPQFVDWQAKLITNDDICASEQAFEPLPYGFDEFLLPLFPPENEALTSLASLTLDEEEEEGPDLVVDQGASSSHSAWNVFNGSTTIPDKRTRGHGPSQPALTASGYTRIVPEVKDEEMEDDSDSDEDEYTKAKRKKEHAKKFRKQRPAQQKQPSVKREYSDDEGWL